jgi:lysylphosphatidylglycerol synthetase-like protein (DUF2156 family)
MKEENLMAPIGHPPQRHAALRALLLALWTVAAIASPFAPTTAGGVLLVVLSTLALAFLPVAGPGRPTLESRGLWSSAAGAAWVTGALASVVLFVRAFGESDREIEAIATGMALAFVPGVAGLALAGLTAAAAFRSELPARDSSPGVAFPAWGGQLGRSLFLALVVWFAWAPRLRWHELPFEPWDWLLRGPALLVLAGATLAFALLTGRAWRRLAPTALAAAGALAALAGLVQALLGMARVSIAQVTAGLQSVTTACFVTLLALALLVVPPSEPRDDRADGARTATSVAYALFPLVSLLLLAITMVMVMTPMKRPL